MAEKVEKKYVAENLQVENDISLADAFEKLGWPKQGKTKLQNLVEWAQYDWSYCDITQNISVVHNVVNEPTYDDFGESEFFVQDKWGYISIFDKMLFEMEKSENV